MDPIQLFRHDQISSYVLNRFDILVVLIDSSLNLMIQRNNVSL
jgi:hypothetical protein